jgi:hypothetical protein
MRASHNGRMLSTWPAGTAPRRTSWKGTVIDMTHVSRSTTSYLTDEARRAKHQARAARVQSACQTMPNLGWQTAYYAAAKSRQAELRAQVNAYRLTAQAPRASAGSGAATRLRRSVGALLIRAGTMLAGAITTAPQADAAPGR